MDKDKARLDLAFTVAQSGFYHNAIKILYEIPDGSEYEGLRNYRLAYLFERTAQYEQALIYAEKATRDPETAVKAQIIRIKTLLNAGQIDYARQIAQACVEGEDAEELELAAIHGHLGFANEKLGRYDEAMGHFVKGNSMTRGAVKRKGITKGKFLASCERYRSYAEGRRVGHEFPRLNSDKDSPVFLVGFPRSGTTLLDTALSMHSQIETLSEIPALGLARNSIIANVGEDAFPGVLTDLDPLLIDQARETYFKKAGEFSKLGSNLHIIDKLPLSMVEIPLILALFPDAKFILALRDPRDSCLSCFKQSFVVNSAMASFLDLNSTVHLYKTVFEMLNLYRRIWPQVPFLEVRYEDVVADFKSEITRILSFLGLNWEEGISSYHEKAKASLSIRTPSYNQVNKPVYKKKLQHWRNYQSYMKPFESELRSFLRQFGYE